MKAHKFFPRVYTDKETKRLSRLYNVDSCPDEYVSSTLGQVEDEIGAQKLLSISKCFGEFVGISRNALEKIIQEDGSNSKFYYIDYLDSRFLRTTEITGDLEIIFPTERLLINQGIRKF